MTAPLSATLLARLRAKERETMVDTADIVSRTRVADSAGGSTYTESTLADVPCRVQANQTNIVETAFGGQLFTGIQWLFVFPYDTSITTDDEIVYQSQRFAVMTVMGPRTNELCRRVIATEK